MGGVLGNGLMFYPTSLIFSISDDVGNLLSVLTLHARRGGGVYGGVVLGFFIWKQAWAVLSSAALSINLNFSFFKQKVQ